MRQLRKSKYAFFVKKENGNYIVYSSLSGAVVVFNKNIYIKMLEFVLDKEIFNYENNDFFNLMIDKKIFIDEYTDESLLVRGLYEEQIIRSNTLEIMLIVTRQCNFRCVYCGQPHLKENMDIKTYDSILKFVENQINSYGYSSVYVTFFGGEPLIASENICSFLEKLQTLLSKLSTNEKTITYKAGMSTNGYLLTPKLFERLNMLKCNFYQISIDGMSETHDKFRPLVSGESTWQRIIDNLSYMVSTDKEFTIQLRTNFNVDVAESLIDFYRFVGENLNDRRINIYYESIKNQGNENTPDTICGMEELVLDVDIAQLIRENNLTCNNCTTRLMPCSQVCYASKPNYFIFDEKNQVLKCSFELDSPNTHNIIGILDEKGSLIENKNNYYNWVYKDYLTLDKCKNCKILPLCFGKRCPKALNKLGDMPCDINIIHAEVEGLLDSYY